ncbi:hypothetical protein JTE90_029410 [Oedothorax gibbosus]|uniref:Antistasin-like domain-containing protein n=1 Tax=Oedothorax gibbosus TaxID=931172 RepID=A0AAV6TLE4_9ARAC|nr:hypothetical protein JTE90_029410 [Oedothorax gibbosus]
MTTFAQLTNNYNVFRDPYCNLLKCGPGCERAQTTSGPNERCPGCICQGRSGECPAMQCELPCQFKKFVPNGCPACICQSLPGMVPMYGK